LPARYPDGGLPAYFFRRQEAFPLAQGKHVDRQETMMIQENLACLRAYRNNIRRYERLLATQLSDPERAFIAKQLEEEQAEAEALVKTTFPFSLPALGQPADAAV
jgi:hypothetical protein